MPNLWDNLFKNAGVWEGTFTTLQPDGHEVSRVLSRLTLEKVGEARARFEVVRYPEDQPIQQTATEFASINRSNMFCEDGSFTKGSMQWTSFSEFGTEFGLTLPNARLRLVQLFKPGGELNYFVLIQETREGKDEVVRSPLSMGQLAGIWRGQATTYFTDWFIAEPVPTTLTIHSGPDPHQFGQVWQVGDDKGQSSARQKGACLFFKEGDLEYQLLLLPNGGSTLCPVTIKPNIAFRCELAWLVDSTTRIRLIRQYKEDGSWSHQTWIKEEKAD
ncbi:MAG: DUF3598 family protein [Cyanobacteria bacterium P01_F01_bin.150]